MCGRQHVAPPNQHATASENRPSRIRTVDEQRHPRMLVQLEQIAADDSILVLQTAIVRRPAIKRGPSCRQTVVVVVVVVGGRLFRTPRNERLTIRTAKRTAYSRSRPIPSAVATDRFDEAQPLLRFARDRCAIGIEQHESRTALLVDTSAGLQLVRNPTQTDGRRDGGQCGGTDDDTSQTTDQWPTAEQPQQAEPASESTCDPKHWHVSQLLKCVAGR